MSNVFQIISRYSMNVVSIGPYAYVEESPCG